MSYNVQQIDFNIIRQHTKECYLRLELLDGNTKQILDYFDGIIISGSLNIDSSSEIRRTFDAVLYMGNDSLLTADRGKIWFNRIVNIKIGYKYIFDAKIHYYPLGQFWFNENSYSISNSGKTLQLKMLDAYCLLDGTRGGTLTSNTIEIPQGSNIRSAMISTLTQFTPIKSYNIGDVGNLCNQAINVYTNQNYNTVPYDLKFTSAGTKVSEVIAKLRDLYPGWQSYIDIDGIFTCQPLPTLKYESDILDAKTIEDSGFIISEQRNNKFSDIHNVVFIWGECITADRSSDSCTSSGNKYTVTFDELDSYIDNYVYAIKVNSTNQASQTMQFNSLSSYPILDSDGNAIASGKIEANRMYCFKFLNDAFYFLGEFQVEGCSILVSELPTTEQKNSDISKYGIKNIYYKVNPDSPFCSDRIGQIVDVKYGDEYSKIYSYDLATQRSNYELYHDTNLHDVIQLKMIFIPWLDVQKKIQYHSLIYDDVREYIIQSISINLKEQTMDVTASVFYPLYNSILN